MINLQRSQWSLAFDKSFGSDRPECKSCICVTLEKHLTMSACMAVKGIIILLNSEVIGEVRRNYTYAGLSNVFGKW